MNLVQPRAKAQIAVTAVYMHDRITAGLATALDPFEAGTRPSGNP